MAKTLSMKKRTKKKTGGIAVKKRFGNAIKMLRGMKPKEQRIRVSMSSRDFINDLVSFLRKIRKRADVIPNKYRKKLSIMKKSLQTLVNSRTSLTKKRSILVGHNQKKRGKKQRGGQQGGILPILIPIIAAAIGAAGSVATGAVSAAVMRA